MNLIKELKKIMYYVKLFDIDEVIKCLKVSRPAVVSFKSFSGIYGAKSGKVPMPNKSEKSCDNHCVSVVGYFPKEKTFKFKNSWGNEWGDKGYGYLSYEYLRKYMLEAWIFEL